jgi:glycosyltransferase involved in cell wall biosynthesis
MARSIAELRKAGLDIVFEIRTAQSNDPALAELKSLDGSVVLPLELYESLPQSLAFADLLVILYDWDTQSRIKARLSMPTKAAEYMASGTPILLYGPPGHAVIEYASREGWGHVVSENDPEKLKEALQEIVTHPVLRERIGRSGIQVAAQNHESQTVCSQFKETLVNSVQS